MGIFLEERKVSKKIIVVTVAGIAALALYAAAKPVTVDMKDANGKSIGTATLTEKKGAGVQIRLNLKGLPAGEHAIHIHQNAKCEVVAGTPAFTSAGGHFNPDQKKHGLQSPDGPHAGDMLNFTVKPDGTAKVTVVDSHVDLNDDPHSLFANGGTALMIHAAADDYKTDPTGNAGARIACGTITKQ
jgi:superoxide dismutase, Cu-Zn family